jgi:hypothetical protein
MEIAQHSGGGSFFVHLRTMAAVEFIFIRDKVR